MLPKNEQYSFWGPHLGIAIVYLISSYTLEFVLYPHTSRVSVLYGNKKNQADHHDGVSDILATILLF